MLPGANSLPHFEFHHVLEEKTEVADRRAESVDDMTAAATAPIPMMETKGGVRYCRVRGRMRLGSPRRNGDGEPYCVRFQSGQHNI
ncbi:hypothetical protein EYF80_052078 [Liparis tanakae]|uniref:Uncharacterized protein n=1 Tax=Liparis tanakae TaxID=230148 RepID=A0A4Z2FA20_9TELE|nr:hypothetical protein EYF80_052078 [Liparis tanakae]